MNNSKKRTSTFTDLEVYKSAYQASLEVLKQILPKLPIEERYDLADQLRRSTKAVPRLVAEAYSKRHQKRGFQALLDTAMQESNEMIVSLRHAKDAYHVEKELCEKLLDVYDKISRQLYKLSLAWTTFKERRVPKPIDVTEAKLKPKPNAVTGVFRSVLTKGGFL